MSAPDSRQNLHLIVRRRILRFLSFYFIRVHVRLRSCLCLQRHTKGCVRIKAGWIAARRTLYTKLQKSVVENCKKNVNKIGDTLVTQGNFAEKVRIMQQNHKKFHV